MVASVCVTREGGASEEVEVSTRRPDKREWRTGVLWLFTGYHILKAMR